MISVNQSTFKQQVLDSSHTVLVNFWAVTAIVSTAITCITTTTTTSCNKEVGEPATETQLRRETEQ